MKFRKDLPESNGSKNFIRLKDKESVIGIFRGDIHEFFQVWKNGKSEEVVEGTPKASFRFRVNFLVKEGPVWVPKIFEQGVTVYKTLTELNDEYDLEKTFVKITRNGLSVNDTTYSIMPLLKQAFTKETEAHLQTLVLNKLTSSEHVATVDQDEEIPF